MFDAARTLGASPPGRLDLRWADPSRWPELQITGGDGAELLHLHAPTRRRPADLLTSRPDGMLALAADAATGDPATLDDAELIDAMVVFERLTAWTSARQARLLAEFARRRPAHDRDAAPDGDAVGVNRYAADEIGLALRLSPGTASIRLEQARRLDADLPDTLDAWEAGRLDATKVRAILDATAPLDPAVAAAVQARVLPRATDQTAGKLRAALGRAVLAVDAQGAARRHERARAGRRVVVNPASDGMASLAALLPAPDALSAYEWLTRLARGMGPDDPRRMDARRADLLVALLTGRLTVAAPPAAPPAAASPVAAATATDATATATATATTADASSDAVAATTTAAASDDDATTGDTTTTATDPYDSAATDAGADGPGRIPMPEPVNPGKPLIQVVVPLDTLTGAAEQPGELVGYGSVPADLARRIAADGIWKRLVTDPLSGALLDHGRTTYRPPAALADFVRARDVHCRHPICRRRAVDSELDHAVAYSEGGVTAASNLYGCCARHHHLKHDAPGWTVTQHPDATITWTTPTGHRYRSEPHDYRTDDHGLDEHGLDEHALARHVLDRAARRSGTAPLPTGPDAATDVPPPF